MRCKLWGILGWPWIWDSGFSGVNICLYLQDVQLWDVKAKQLKSWVDRGLINVKLLDRTLAYFQNQSSYLQYIKTLKRPVPRIESPGFPGTQWSEFYWKDQTVMLLMLETDFPDGKNPEFCAKLFREEPGVWKLKMEQFKRWLEKGKNDPLPEYYGTGKNCSVCGVFLFDTKSYLKHMKRNHGYKIKDKDKLLLKSEKLKGKEDKSRDEDDLSPETAPPVRTVLTKAQMKAQDPFDMIMTGSLPSTSRLPPPQISTASSHSIKDDDNDSDLDDSHPVSLDMMTKDVKKEEKKIPESVLIPSLSRRKATQNKKYVEDEEDQVKKKSEMTSSSVRKPAQKKKHIEEADEKEKNKVDLLPASSKKTLKQKKYTEEIEEDEDISIAPASSSSRRRAISQPEFKDEMVTCPECDFQCLHSKIVQHLKRCTKKMAQTKKLKETAKPSKPQQTDKAPTTTTQSENKINDPESKKPKQSDIVKKAFLKKFEAQQKMDYFSDSDAEMNLSRKESQTEESDQDKEEKQPSLKLKFSRKDSGSDLSHFEVSNENIRRVDEKESSKDDEPGPDTSLSAILRNINADRSEPKQDKPPLLKSSVIPQISPPKIGAKPDKQDDSSDDEVIPQKSFRLHSFIESLRAMHARLPQRKEDPPDPPPAPEPTESPPKPTISVESANLKNKWLQSLEDRSKVKPPEPSPAVNKIQSEIAQMKNKESLIYNKAKLKAYPETIVKTSSSLKETVSPTAHIEEEKITPPKPLKRKKKAATFDDDEDEFPAKATRKSETQQSMNKDHQKEEYHDGRPSLRKGNKMIPCPICGAEYAIADNLQKHIDKDHFGETDRVFMKRVKPKSESKEKEKAEPSRKKKKGSSSLTTFDDEEDEFLGDSRPSLDTSTAEEKFDSLMASSSTAKKDKKVAIQEDQDEEEESTKLTEYEIFQKLQLKDSTKTEKKRVECSECGKMLPVNTIKRHLLKHEKDALMEKEGSEAAVAEAQVKSKPQPKPRGRKKNNSGTRNRKQESKQLKKEEEVEKKSESIKSHDDDDERIQCPLNLKKMIMKRHLMKPEADTEDTVKHEKKVEENDETDGGKPPAAAKGRKKKTASSTNVAKRQIEKQTKTKKKAMDDPEMYAPIEITPTKEYWEYEKEKKEKSFDFPSADDDDIGPSKKPRKGSDPEIRNKSLQDLKDAEKSRNTSEEESESENSLEAAVRKVVSYRMTPKQALSHYNLTPKVMVSHHNSQCFLLLILIHNCVVRFCLTASWVRLTRIG